jgi:hypothetical protein
MSSNIFDGILRCEFNKSEADASELRLGFQSLRILIRKELSELFGSFELESSLRKHTFDQYHNFTKKRSRHGTPA